MGDTILTTARSVTHCLIVVVQYQLPYTESRHCNHWRYLASARGWNGVISCADGDGQIIAGVITEIKTSVVHQAGGAHCTSNGFDTLRNHQ
jgi:hypothetical protein